MSAKRSVPVEEIKDGVLKMMDLLDSGDVTAEQLRERARELPDAQSLLCWIDFAEMLHECPKKTETPALVKNPRFRAGTGMQPAAWADCLWQPSGD